MGDATELVGWLQTELGLWGGMSWIVSDGRVVVLDRSGGISGPVDEGGEAVLDGLGRESEFGGDLRLGLAAQ